MNKPISRQTKDAVYKVYKYFEMRKHDSSSFEYVNDVNLAKTVSEATGFSETSIKKIVKEGRAMEAEEKKVSFKAPRKNILPKKRIEINSFIEGVIRRKICQCYTVKKCIPTLKKINAELKDDNILCCSREYLRQAVHRLGFKFLSCQSKRKVIVERHDIMRLRWSYIQDIKQYRLEGKPIIYLDETFVDQSHVPQSCLQSKTERAIKTKRKGPRLIIVHAGNRNGFVNNALLIYNSHSTTGKFQGEMNTTNFEKWVKEKLIPNIPQNSVVVMDNAAYHNSQIDKKPTMISLKVKMHDWLVRRGIQYDESMHKCDLIKLINDQNTEKWYKIDEILKEQGHTVLRLPPYHRDLNPMERVWCDIREEIARTAVDTNLEKKIDLVSLFSNYPPEKWQKCEEYVIKNEEEYYESDRVFDEEFDKLLISLNEHDDDDDDDEDDETEEEYESDMEIDI